jgi:integrase
MLAKGIEPKGIKAAAREPLTGVTFRECAERYIASHVNTDKWRNPKHRQQWTNTLETYVFPIFGNVPVEAVDRGLIVRALDPIWTQKPETARRVRGRIKTVLDWAIGRGLRQAANSVPTVQGMGPQRRIVRHHPALPHEQVPAFMAALRARLGTSARCLEFTILTASRTNEAIGAGWAEINFAEKLWTIPAARMKGGRDHRVPLNPSSIAVLKQMQGMRQNDWVFPGDREGKPISNMAMLELLKQMNADNEKAGLPRWTDPNQGADVVPHGFRSTFRDWAGETTSFPRDVAEAALAHSDGDKTELAYKRGDLFVKRRKLMEAWAAHCCRHADEAKIVQLRRQVPG